MNKFDEISKNHGHRRMPTLGKALTISSFLYNISSTTSSALKSQETKDSSLTSLSDNILKEPKNLACVKDEEKLNKTKMLSYTNKKRKSITEDDFMPKDAQDLIENEPKELEFPSGAVRRLSAASFSKRNSCTTIAEEDLPKQLPGEGKEIFRSSASNYDQEENATYSNDDDINPAKIKDKNEIAEALAKTSALTSTTKMKQRLAARNLEIEMNNAKALQTGINDKQDENGTSTSTSSPTAGFDTKAVREALTAYTKNYEKNPIQFTSEYQGPPKDILMYLVRMGSFNSAPKINNIDSQDDDLEIPGGLNSKQLLDHVKRIRGEGQPPLLSRFFTKPSLKASSFISHDITDGLRCLELNSVSRVCSAPTTTTYHIRLLQWNVLSQTLGQNNDGFVCCPEKALTWEHRKYLIVQEILQNDPDIVCLQEVDHFKFLQNILGSINYDGIFFPKPDSPCLYIQENNGPDGCAIFYKRDKFELKKSESRILEVWRVQSNQVAVAVNLFIKDLNKEFSVCTTHLKARRGALLAQLRNEQGRDLMRFVKEFSGERPVLLCGDFNAEPTEPIYSSILQCDFLNLSSAYADMRKDIQEANGSLNYIDETDMKNPVQKSIDNEPPYTTWKIRENGEECHTIDYVFYSKDKLKVKNCLEFPSAEAIGLNRTPSYQYPSDHFSLVCDFDLVGTKAADTN